MIIKLFLVFLALISSRLHAQDHLPKVNHVYIVVDSTTFNGLKSSVELKKWVNIDRGLPGFLPVDDSSTVIYMRLKSTYLEIMGPHNKFKESLGSIGIGFSWDTDEQGQVEKIERELKKSSELPFSKSESNWTFDAKELVWYTAFYTKLQGDIATWYAVYNPVFLDYLYPGKHIRFTREDFLQKAYDPDKQMVDISEIVIDCNKVEFNKITNEFKALHIKAESIHPQSAVFMLDSVKILLNQSERKKSMIRELKITSKKNSRPIHLLLGKTSIISGKKNEISIKIK
ncbi:hypothetical protein EG347_01160 [Chryseobacterium sp. G0186]|uniref:DUF5829 family protein n=1 Tax=Chryseobacterium sp. G0186 TaxID=2487064 RepID=UPI000F4E9D42|nr:DUF5829 family protein [Chryseobacterium sp. G0186]AZA76232.1 hypothetical protein EG347_01160 [Chryseobacterium sp. G0186]